MSAKSTASVPRSIAGWSAILKRASEARSFSEPKTRRPAVVPIEIWAIARASQFKRTGVDPIRPRTVRTAS